MLEQEMYRVEREIKTHGVEYTVFFEVYNNNTDAPEERMLCSFRGIFHISKGFSNGSFFDATETHEKGQPMILCLFKDIQELKRASIIYHNDKKYRVVDINDIGGYAKVADLSLEVIIDGEQEY